MTRKNRYQAMVVTYEKRRKELKRKQKAQIGRLSYKIKLWKREIRRIQERQNRINQIAIKVEEFTGKRTKNSSPKREGLLARKILFKYCLENGMRGVDLAQYAGCKDKRTPLISRRTFNRDILRSPDIKELWLRFKILIQESDL